jgi:hypothetical protein
MFPKKPNRIACACESIEPRLPAQRIHFNLVRVPSGEKDLLTSRTDDAYVDRHRAQLYMHVPRIR